MAKKNLSRLLGSQKTCFMKLIEIVDKSVINGVDKMGRTPFFLACSEGIEGSLEAVKLLMKDDMIKKYEQLCSFMQDILMDSLLI